MGFNSIVNVILEEREVLYEGRKIRYKDYFNDYKEYCFKRIKAVYTNPAGLLWDEEVTNEILAREQGWDVQGIENYIEIAIRTGKREDRVIWLLRHLKFKMYHHLLVLSYSYDNLLGDLYPCSDIFVVP